MFPILSFSVLMAVLFNGPGWAKAILVLSAAPIAIVLNAIRVGIIGVLVDAYGIEMARGALHFMQGWVIFGGCLALLWMLARLLWGGREGHMLDLQGVNFSQARSDLAATQFREPTYFAIGATAALALVLAAWPSADRPLPDREALVTLPTLLPAWQAQSTPLLPDIERVLDADDYVDAALIAPGGTEPVNLFVAWYADQSSGKGLHAPEVCLPAGGWEIAALRRHSITIEGTEFAVNRAIITRQSERRLVYYWFDLRGQAMTSAVAAKAQVLVDRVTTGRSDGALIRIMTPIATGETDADAEARLHQVLRPILPLLPTYVPR
jgi:exosortase D (VPLPA-CTERM-specific)